jgi:7,8-dihydroneopterin aldolase/epimerase/oxygenase
MKREIAGPLSHPGLHPLWNAGEDYTRIVLRDVQVDVKCGLHPWEKHPERPNRLVINVEMFAPALPKEGKNAASIINYDHIHDALKSWPARPHVPLLETLAEELISLCFQNTRVAACRVSILKPDIFKDAAGAGVEIYRRRA